jgi:hypothetical protein
MEHLYFWEAAEREMEGMNWDGTGEGGRWPGCGRELISRRGFL